MSPNLGQVGRQVGQGMQYQETLVRALAACGSAGIHRSSPSFQSGENELHRATAPTGLGAWALNSFASCLSHAVDFVVHLNATDIQKLVTAFPAPEFYLPPLETILAETARAQHGHFNLIHRDTGFKADMYPTGRDELNAWAFRGKRPVEFEGETIMLAPPEYVIVRKLEYYREGHAEKYLRDIRAMLAVSGDQLERAQLN